jgi:hypothetical protein
MIEEYRDERDCRKGRQLVQGFKLCRSQTHLISTAVNFRDHHVQILVTTFSRMCKIVQPDDNMALIAEAMSVVKPFDREDEVESLSDEQIEQLLQQATVRLREQQAIKLDSRYTPAIPAAGKLMVSTVAKPYIQTTGDIAKADTSRLVDEQHRQLADGAIRKVEDPVTVKQRNLEVRYAAFPNTLLANEENFPKVFSLDAESRAPSWCPSALYESIYS